VKGREATDDPPAAKLAIVMPTEESNHAPETETATLTEYQPNTINKSNK
jgi:hypothetical protein